MANLQTLKPFQKGQDDRRNTKGRRKGSVNMKTSFIETLVKILEEKILVNGERVTNEDLLARQLIVKAHKGVFWAYKLYMEYTYGKPIKYCRNCESVKAEAEARAISKKVKLTEEQFDKFIEMSYHRLLRKRAEQSKDVSKQKD